MNCNGVFQPKPYFHNMCNSLLYAHILDEDRKINAQKFESAFYSNPDLRKVAPPPEESQSQTVDLAALIEQLQKSPELANTLASIIAGQKAC